MYLRTAQKLVGFDSFIQASFVNFGFCFRLALYCEHLLLLVLLMLLLLVLLMLLLLVLLMLLLFAPCNETERGPEHSCRINTQGS